MDLLASLLIIAAAVYAVVRRAEVRLTLLLAALALGALAGPQGVVAVVQKFLATCTQEQYLIPLGFSLGFAYVLRHTGCDRHLVQLLVRPLRRVRAVLLPGVVVVGALVNVVVISQAATVATIGPVLVPLLRAARVSPATGGAALLLGASIGGDQLNPGAPEIATISTGSPGHVPPADCVARVFPLLLIHLAVSASVFWVLGLRAEARCRKEAEAHPPGPDAVPSFRVNPLKALVPVVPLVLLFLTALPPPYRAFEVPQGWLVAEGKGPAELLRASFNSRLIGAAMLVGSVLASLTDWRRAGGSVKAFFEGAGYAMANIISLIVAAVCFGEGVKRSGLAARLGQFIEARPGLLLPCAAALPLAFAWTCGSGMASTQSLFGFLVGPAQRLGADPVAVGALASLSAAAGRTMSPVAAVVLMCAGLTDTSPIDLVRRVALPLAAGVTAMLLLAGVLAAH